MREGQWASGLVSGNSVRRCGCRRGDLPRTGGFEPGGAYTVRAESSREDLLALKLGGPDRVAKWKIQWCEELRRCGKSFESETRAGVGMQGGQLTGSRVSVGQGSSEGNPET